MMGAGGRGAETPVLLEDTLSYCWRTGRGGPRPTMILVIYIPEVPLDKLRCISTIKKNGVFFVLCSILIKSSRSRMKNIFHSLRLIGFLQYLCRSIYKKHII